MMVKKNTYNRAFQHVRTAYISTLVIANANFSEDSTCAKTYQRLNIIFGLDEPTEASWVDSPHP